VLYHFEALAPSTFTSPLSDRSPDTRPAPESGKYRLRMASDGGEKATVIYRCELESHS
jgi:hypothetical protein